jgi:hypothetical protein
VALSPMAVAVSYHILCLVFCVSRKAWPLSCCCFPEFAPELLPAWVCANCYVVASFADNCILGTSVGAFRRNPRRFFRQKNLFCIGIGHVIFILFFIYYLYCMYCIFDLSAMLSTEFQGYMQVTGKNNTGNPYRSGTRQRTYAQYTVVLYCRSILQKHLGLRMTHDLYSTLAVVVQSTMQ